MTTTWEQKPLDFEDWENFDDGISAWKAIEKKEGTNFKSETELPILYYNHEKISLFHGDINTKNLKNVLENSINLKDLFLSTSNFDEKNTYYDILSIMESLVLNKSLEKLNITQRCKDSDFPSHILEKLSHHPTLNSLSITHKFGKEKLIEICNLIKNGWKISKLSLNINSNLDVESRKEVEDIWANMLKTNTTLKELDCCMSFENCEKWIPFNKTMKRIMVKNKGSKSNGEAFEVDANLLFKNNILKTISQDWQTEQDLSFTLNLKNHPSIQSFKFSEPEWNGEEIDKVASMNLKGMIFFELKMNQIAIILKKNPQLISFTSTFSSLDSDEDENFYYPKIRKAVLNHPNLKKLNLDSWSNSLIPLFEMKKQWKVLKLGSCDLDEIEWNHMKTQFHLKKFTGANSFKKSKAQLNINAFCQLNINWQKTMNQANLSMVIQRYYAFIGKEYKDIIISSTLTSTSFTCFLIWALNRIFPIDMIKLILQYHWWFQDLEEKSFIWKHIKDETLSWYY